MFLRPLAYLLVAIALCAFAACADTPTTDDTEQSSDTEASDGESTGQDGTGQTDSDTSDTDETEAPAEEPTPEPGDDGTTGGLDCSEDAAICDAPFECLEGICRLPIAGITEADVDFEFTQPEELDSIFSLFKAFTNGVKFFVMDVDLESPIFNRFGARYGSADIISENPIEVAWQGPDDLESIFFTPHTPVDGLDDGRSWVTEPFTYKLRTSAQIQFGTFQNDADIALDILDAVVVYRMMETGVPSLATVNGVLTREEAEYRELGTHDELEGIMANFVCVEVPDFVPEPTDGEIKWHLSDVLDCNTAALDLDYNGDGTMDAYAIELEVEMATADLVEQP